MYFRQFQRNHNYSVNCYNHFIGNIFVCKEMKERDGEGENERDEAPAARL